MQVELLTYTEMLFIKKYSYGMFFNEIKRELCIINDYEFAKMKDEVKLKLSIVNDLELINKAFNIGLLVVDDFILKNINHISFGIAYNLYLENEKKQLSIDNLQYLYVKVYNIYLKIIKINKQPILIQ